MASTAFLQQNKKKLNDEGRRVLKGLPEPGEAPPASMTCRGA
jgi:hypothetical protein